MTKAAGSLKATKINGYGIYGTQTNTNQRLDPNGLGRLDQSRKNKAIFLQGQSAFGLESRKPDYVQGKILFIIPFEMHRNILEIEPKKRLKYNLKNAKSSSISIVTDTLEYANGITTLTITDDVGQGEGAQKRFRKSNGGWDKILNGLMELAESDQ